jgi:hypothetical protein
MRSTLHTLSSAVLQALLLLSAQATRPVRPRASALAQVYAEELLDSVTAARNLLQVRYPPVFPSQSIFVVFQRESLSVITK